MLPRSLVEMEDGSLGSIPEFVYAVTNTEKTIRYLFSWERYPKVLELCGELERAGLADGYVLPFYRALANLTNIETIDKKAEIENLGTVIKSAGNGCPIAYVCRASYFLFSGKYEETGKDLDRAIRLIPDNPYLLFFRTNLFYREAKKDEFEDDRDEDSYLRRIALYERAEEEKAKAMALTADVPRFTQDLDARMAQAYMDLARKYRDDQLPVSFRKYEGLSATALASYGEELERTMAEYLWNALEDLGSLDIPGFRMGKGID
jgi:tetratricopeptide (TPR) repeat protein